MALENSCGTRISPGMTFRQSWMTFAMMRRGVFLKLPLRRVYSVASTSLAMTARLVTTRL